MDNTWWVNPQQLDDDQKRVIAAPLNESQLVLGPPGSGKSNLLLLRANYIQMAGQPNSEILVFTKQLQDFMRSGSVNYSFPPSKIRTSFSWSIERLREYDYLPKLSKKFLEKRMQLCQALSSLIKERHISNLYEYIFLDEAQDYLPAEIDNFFALSRYIFAVGDNNQKIYSGSDGLSHLKNKVNTIYPLQHHYRNGLKICRLADGIAKQTDDYVELASTSNYDEKAAPSSVDPLECKCHEEIFELVQKGIILQLKAYPNEFIGILTPRNEELGIISEYMRNTEFYRNSQVQLRADPEAILDATRPIVVSTIHSAKGLEFRALHLCFLAHVKNFPKQRNICYTGVTRAKTALYIYHNNDLPGYMEQAIANSKRPPSLPSIDDLFVREEN